MATTTHSLVVERTDWLDQHLQGISEIHDLAWGQSYYGQGTREIEEMTIDNRGAAVRLRRRERLVWTPPRGEQKIWYGIEFRYVVLRMWHDGSVTVETELER